MARGRSGELSWYISAICYRWSSTEASIQADRDLISYLGSRLADAVIIDCGAGPGLLSRQLLDHHPRLVVAVDANPRMVDQARQRLRTAEAEGKARVEQRYIDAHYFDSLTEQADRRPDACIFKRSLYRSRAETEATLRAAVRALAPGGVIAVVHPERSLRRYVLGEPARLRGYSAFHLFNRVISRASVLLGLSSSYRTYDRTELLGLLGDVSAGGTVSAVPSSQASYTVAVLTVTDQKRFVAGPGPSNAVR